MECAASSRYAIIQPMNPEIFAQLKHLADFLWEHPNQFYRDKWSRAGFAPEMLKTPADFSLVPFLEKNEIVRAQKNDPLSILFGPASDIAYVQTTSMTTQTAKSGLLPDAYEILLALKTDRSYNLQDPVYRTCPVRPARVLLLDHARRMLARFFNAKMWLAENGFPIVGDILNLGLTAEIAARVKIDAIVSGSSQAIFGLIPHLEANRFPADQIIFILSGVSNRTEAAALRAFFPKAYIYTGYGLSEFDGSVAATCRDIAAGDFSKPISHHPRFRIFVEIIDPKNGRQLGEGEAGEIVVSHLDTRSPFPMLRYRTGDRGKLIPAECTCNLKDHQSLWLQYLGRLNPDVVLASGAILTRKEFTEAISGMHDLVHEKFEVRISQERSGSKVAARIDIGLSPRDSGIAPEVISTRFAQLLQISPRFSLEDAIKTGAFAEPRIRFFTAEEHKTLPRSRLIDCLEY